MPPLASRIFPRSTLDRDKQMQHPSAPFDGNDTPLSPPGNPAPNRGVFPPEFTYDFQTARFYPDTAQFLRGAVDINTPIRNLALQAAAAAGLKVT